MSIPDYPVNARKNKLRKIRFFNALYKNDLRIYQYFWFQVSAEGINLRFYKD